MFFGRLPVASHFHTALHADRLQQFRQANASMSKEEVVHSLAQVPPTQELSYLISTMWDPQMLRLLVYNPI